MAVYNVQSGTPLQPVFDISRPGDEIVLAPGEYRQKTVLRTPGVTLRGESAQTTRLVWGDYATKIHQDGKEFNTFRTWTLAVCADGVTIRDLAIVNDAGHPETLGQEVALSVVGDDFTMEDCTLTSTQDTLFVGPLPDDLIARYDGFLTDELRRGGSMAQVFRRCLIEGTVDFIFGCGKALFEECEIRSLADARNTGYLAAPAHALTQTEGFVFRNCALTAGPGVAPSTIYLARPWRDYGMTTFENCTVGPHIAPEGFDKWNDTERDKTARFFETPPVEGRVQWCNRRAPRA